MINEANTGFMLLAASLVMLMTPGLAFFYGGLVGPQERAHDHDAELRLDGHDDGAVVAVRLLALLQRRRGRHLRQLRPGVPARRDAVVDRSRRRTIPLIVFIAYQMMFAIITPALITGAFANRVTFKAYLIFLVVWLLFVYFPFVHMVWGGGLLAHWGVLDFAGGIVVHAIGRLGGAGLGALRRQARRRRARTAFRSWRSAPACCGSAGTGSTRAASSKSTPSPPWRS